MRALRLSAPACLQFRHLFLLLVMLLGVATSASTAQSGSYLYDWAPRPESNQAPVEYGYVEQTDGHLHLEIPLGPARKGRDGKSSVEPRLTYDSNIWGPLGMGSSMAWNPHTGWRLLPSVFNWGSQGYSGSMQWGVEDGAGSAHFFPCSSNCYSTEGAGYWYDGSAAYGPDGSLIASRVDDFIGKTFDANGNFSSIAFGYGILPPVYGQNPGDVYYDSSGLPILNVYESGLIQSPPGPWADTFYHAPNMSAAGADRVYTQHDAAVLVNTAFHETRYPISECMNGGQYPSCFVTVMSQLELPDGTSFHFRYDCDPTIAGQADYCSSPPGRPAYYGALTEMVLPTGRTITYAYQPFADAYNDVSLGLVSRSNGDGTWTYSQSVISACHSVTDVGCQQSFTTVEPNGRTNTITNVMNNGAWPIVELVTDGAGHNLSRKQMQWDFSHPNQWLGHASAYIHKQSEVVNSWDSTGGVETSRTEYYYDSPEKGNVTSVKRWGFRPGYNWFAGVSADTITYTSYYSPANTPLTDPTVAMVNQEGGTNVINKPLSITICGGTGNDSACKGVGTRVSQQTFTYDQYGSGLQSAAGAANHNDQVYGTTQQIRGNPTSISRWVGGLQSTSESFTYDTTGQVTSHTDANGNVTSYDYSDNYFVDNGTATPGVYVPATPTHAHATTVTLPPVHGQTYTAKSGYFFGNQKVASTTDVNNNTTSYSYGDPLDRLTQVRYPLGWTLTQYISPTQVDTYKATTDLAPSATCTGCLHSTLTLDTLGRVVQAVAPNGAKTDTTYDSMGNIQSVSNPYLSFNDPTYGVTNYVYDVLGRLCLKANPDSSSFSPQCLVQGVNNVYYSYFLSGGTKVDETGMQWKYQYDPLGRLAAVTEPNSAVTQYTHDVLGNLLSVTQNGLAGETPVSRQFTYDRLSRLLTSYNPETGPVCYGILQGSRSSSNGINPHPPIQPNPPDPDPDPGPDPTPNPDPDPPPSNCVNGYDANGNLLHKTDASGMTIDYTYDTWNRVTDKSAPDNGMTSHHYYYDRAMPGLTSASNGVGRLAVEWVDGQAGTSFDYDAMGRVNGTVWYNFSVGQWQPAMLASYDLAGNPTAVHYPSGRSVLNAYDAAGRLSNVTDTTPGGPGTVYFQATSYAPSGALTGYTLGNGVTAGLRLNSRLQPCRSWAETPSIQLGPHSYILPETIMDRQIFYADTAEPNCGAAPGNNGNIFHIMGEKGRTQNFTYDPLNRLSSAYTTFSTQNTPGPYSSYYEMDSFGNTLLHDMLDSGTTHDFHLPVDGSNRLTNTVAGYSYNPTGTLATANGHSFMWTAEGTLRAVDGFSTGSYLYNAEGQRTLAVRNDHPPYDLYEAAQYLYLNGQPMAEQVHSPSWVLTGWAWSGSGRTTSTPAARVSRWPIHPGGPLPRPPTTLSPTTSEPASSP